MTAPTWMRTAGRSVVKSGCCEFRFLNSRRDEEPPPFPSWCDLSQASYIHPRCRTPRPSRLILHPVICAERESVIGPRSGNCRCLSARDAVLEYFGAQALSFDHAPYLSATSARLVTVGPPPSVFNSSENPLAPSPAAGPVAAETKPGLM